MSPSLSEGIQALCALLEKHSVEVILVGGAAVAMHGYYRASIDAAGKPLSKPDIDFWYNPSYDNYFKLLNALEELEVDVDSFRAEKTPNPRRSFFKLELELMSVDFLPEIVGLGRFFTSFQMREQANLGSVSIGYLSYEDLILAKKASNRAQDRDDLNQLEALISGPKD